jgi:hypothetical protein
MMFFHKSGYIGLSERLLLMLLTKPLQTDSAILNFILTQNQGEASAGLIRTLKLGLESYLHRSSPESANLVDASRKLSLPATKPHHPFPRQQPQ